MAWSIEFSRPAQRQLAKLDKTIAEQILLFLEERAAVHPQPRELATPLAGPLKGLWRFRVGDYRVLCDIRDAELIILTVAIGHRKEIYH